MDDTIRGEVYGVLNQGIGSGEFVTAAARGIRGAVTVSRNSKTEILTQTRKLLKQMVAANKVAVEDIACIIFSVTPDIDAEFPANAARQLGWVTTPLLCTCEIPVPRSLPLCIRVMMIVNSTQKQDKIRPVYLGRARGLRPDL